MKRFHKKQISKRAANPYASMENFRRLFAENMNALYRLSPLLTRDLKKAWWLTLFFAVSFPLIPPPCVSIRELRGTGESRQEVL